MPSLMRIRSNGARGTESDLEALLEDAVPVVESITFDPEYY